VKPQTTLIAHCHLGLGALYRRTGKPQQAREHLTAATTMYREIGMTHWLWEAEMELRSISSFLVDRSPGHR